jgi:hypothetical protein
MSFFLPFVLLLMTRRAQELPVRWINGEFGIIVYANNVMHFAPASSAFVNLAHEGCARSDFHKE